MKIFGYEIKRALPKAPVNDQTYQDYMAMLRQFIHRGMPVPIDDNPTAYITQAFMRNPTVYALIMLRANAAKGVPWLAYKVKDVKKFREYKAITMPAKELGQTLKLKEQSLVEVEHTPLNRILTTPNSYQSWADLLEEVFAYRDVTGNAYLFMTINEVTGKPSGLHVAPADRVRIVGNDYLDPIQGYQIETISRNTIAPKNIIHWKYVNLRWGADGRDLYGMSPLRAAAGIIAQDNMAIDGQSAAFFNEGVKGIITGTEQTAIEFSKEQGEAIQEKWNRSSGFRNRNKIQFNRAPLNFVRVGDSPVDLGVLEARRANKEALCNIFRVHPALLSESASTLDNLKEARKMLMTSSILPDLDSFREHLNSRVATLFGDEYWIDYDLMAINELQDDIEKLAATMRTMDWITINEKRTATNYDAFEDPAADMLYMPASSLPLGMDFDTGFDRIDEQLNKARK